MVQSPPTLRSLARSLGLSHATVSAALNGRGRVRADTARSVQAAARAAGYHANPLTSAVMSEVRRSRTSTVRAIVAMVEMMEPDRPRQAASYNAEIVRGAEERGAALGFKIDPLVVGGHGVPRQRLDSILKARGIRRVILLPAWHEPDISCLDWGHHHGVYTDYVIERPALPSIHPDHYRGMMMALQHLRALGYRRPGLFVGPHQDERIQYRWEAAFLAFASNCGGLAQAVPRLKSATADQGEFVQWFRDHEPDVVLAHHPEAMAWMASAGASVPETHGFLCLNRLCCPLPCAGLDLRPRLIGALALEQVTAQWHRPEAGPAAETRSTISVMPQWVAGPTLREIARPGAAADPAPLAFPNLSAGEPVSQAG
jgi:DNA-binding LacI/PurR family transcriptional regulator